MDLSSSRFFDGHERIVPLEYKKTGLAGFIAIHNTVLGPATGGTRFWHYSSPREALDDALRLSHAMTYKCALAGVPFGGGKGVIMARPRIEKTPAFLKSYAAQVNALGGIFSTGEDVGITDRDIEVLVKYSPHINGRSKKTRNLGPWAALGIFYAMRAALKTVFGTESFREKTVAVKGLGKVGRNVCKLLQKEGARVIAADVDERAVRGAQKEFPGLTIVQPDAIHKEPVDVYSPCALGNEFTPAIIRQLHCAIVCGGANNQLGEEEDGERLHRAGILYIPDYVVNAGGLINVVAEMRPGGYSPRWARKKIEKIEKTTARIVALAQKRGKSPSAVANRLAQERLQQAAQKSKARISLLRLSRSPAF